MRVYRSGGFTKDYLYLKGFSEILFLKNNGYNLHNLLIGKTSVRYRELLDELVERNVLSAPIYKTNSFVQPSQINPIMDYLVKGVRARAI